MIAERIQDLLPSEWPVTVGDLPAPNVAAVVIMEYDGSYNTEYFGPQQGSTISSPIIKIVARNTSYEVGRQWINRAKEILHRYHDDFFLSIRLVGSPMYLGRSSQKFHEFQVTFITQIKE